MLSFFPRDVLDKILNLIDSVSEDFPSYSCFFRFYTEKKMMLILRILQATLSLIPVTSHNPIARIVYSRRGL